MRDLIVTENVTLDGIMSPLSGWFDDPTAQDDEMMDVSRAQDENADALVLGRVTFEEFAGFWPDLKDDDTGISDYLNRVRKFVVSGTVKHTQWQHTTILSGPAEHELRRLKAAPGKDIVITGSGTLVRSLQSTDLIDEYRMFVYPVVLGHGRRLFPDGMDARLQLAEARSFASGVVLLRYRVRG